MVQVDASEPFQDGKAVGVEELVRGLRLWVADHDVHVRAGVELLIGHGHWLRDEEFVGACVRRVAGWWVIDWAAAEVALEAGLGGSSTERAVLAFAIALGCDRYRFSVMGPVNAALLVGAAACALRVVSS